MYRRWYICLSQDINFFQYQIFFQHYIHINSIEAFFFLEIMRGHLINSGRVDRTWKIVHNYIFYSVFSKVHLCSVSIRKQIIPYNSIPCTYFWIRLVCMSCQPHSNICRKNWARLNLYSSDSVPCYCIYTVYNNIIYKNN